LQTAGQIASVGSGDLGIASFAALKRCVEAVTKMTDKDPGLTIPSGRLLA
jgi:hypothetical protein